MTKNLKNTLLAAVMLLSTHVFAQDEDPDNPGGDPGEPAAPIGDYIPLLMLSAIGLGYKLLSKPKVSAAMLKIEETDKLQGIK